MGFGDDLLATGMARGAKGRGKRIAFGDGRNILWGPWSEPMFRHNPNIAEPGGEGDPDIEWIAHYKGHRLYNRREGNRWIWNFNFNPIPGEIFFSEEESEFAREQGSGFILIEPNVPAFKRCAPNKRWPLLRYEKIARYLFKGGYDVRQFAYGSGDRLQFAKPMRTPSFRHALASLARASIYIGPEGGLHHGAAAVGVSGVVIFGGFIPPSVTGYPIHTNLTGGVVACGSLKTCRHCRAAMDAITVDEVHEAALSYLTAQAA